MSLKKDIEKLIAEVEAQGFRAEKRTHWIVYGKDGRTIVNIPATPSSARTIRNAQARLKRIGFDPKGRS